jgi:hypothetical protein
VKNAGGRARWIASTRKLSTRPIAGNDFQEVS